MIKMYYNTPIEVPDPAPEAACPFRRAAFLAGVFLAAGVVFYNYVRLESAGFSPRAGAANYLALALGIAALGALGAAALRRRAEETTVEALGLANEKLTKEIETRRAAEEQLNLQKENLLTFFESLRDFVFIVRPDGLILKMNPAVHERLGYPAAPQGLNILDVFPTQSLDAARRMLTGPANALPAAIAVLAPDGRHFPCEVSAARGRWNGADALFIIARDVGEIVRAKDAAEYANRAKTHFLANMSHEIRTPLHAISGMTELLAATELTKEQREYVNAVELSSDVLLGIVNDILDFSKIEAGCFRVKNEPFELKTAMEAAAGVCRAAAKSKNLTLELSLAPGLPASVIGDSNIIRQILVNLMSNAIKFTAQGRVEVRAQRAGEAGEIDGAKRVNIRFTVSDTGVGIPRGARERLFQRFSQADDSYSRKHGGTGLGLAIVKSLCELAGGSVQLESEPGEGTSFHVTLPYIVYAGVPVKSFSSFSSAPGALSRADMAAAAKHAGQSPFDAARNARGQNAQEPAAMETAQLLPAGEDPIPGWTPRQLKQGEASAASPAPDQAAGGPSGTNSAACAGGAAQIPGERETSPAKPFGAPPSGTPPRGKVLVVEDHSISLRLAIFVLEKAGYQAEGAWNGKIAVEMAAAARYDAVLMDLHMPEMDGFEATRKIRAAEKASGLFHVPIIALTADATREAVAECMASGMDGYVVKPIRSALLLEALAKWVRA